MMKSNTKTKINALKIIVLIIFILFGTKKVYANIELSNGNDTTIISEETQSKLKGISLKTTEVKPGGKVYVELIGLDSSVDKVKLYTGVEEKYLTIEIKDIHNNAYFDMPTNAIPGKSYSIKGVVEIIDSDGNKYTYSKPEISDEFYGNATIKVIPSEMQNKLKGISVKTPEVKPGGKVYVELISLDSSVDKVKLYMGVEDKYLTIEIKDIHNNAYFDMPTNAIPGKSYSIKGVVEIIDSDGNKYTYSKPEISDEFYGNATIKVIPSEMQNKLKGISVKTPEVKSGEKVYVELIGLDSSVDKVKLYMGVEEKYLTIEIKDIHNNAYFDMPTNAIPGKSYSIKGVVEIIDSDGNKYTYSKPEISDEFYGNTTITVLEKNGTITEDNNEKDETTVKGEIPKAGSKSIITVLMMGIIIVFVIHMKNRTFKDWS